MNICLNSIPCEPDTEHFHSFACPLVNEPTLAELARAKAITSELQLQNFWRPLINIRK